MDLLSPAGFRILACSICALRRGGKPINDFAGHLSLAIVEVMRLKPGSLVLIALDCRSMSNMPFARNMYGKLLVLYMYIC